MIRQQWAIFAATIIAISCSGCIDDITGEMKKQKNIVDQVKLFAEDGLNIEDPNSLVLHGKALIWDLKSNSRSPVYDLLPSDLKAVSTDKMITVFLIKGSRNVKVGTYSISREPAYRQYMDILVIYWPQNSSAGLYSVVSEEPRSSRQVENNPEYGDPNKPIAEWITHLKQE